MAHERHPDFLEDARFHQAGIERVAQIVETNGSELGVPECRCPRAFDGPDRLGLVVDDQPSVLAVLKQKLMEPLSQGDLARLPFGRLRARNRHQLAGEIDVLPPLAGDFAAPHAGIEGGNDHGAQVTF